MSFWPKPPHFSTDAMGLSQVPAVSTHLASPTASTDASPRSYSSVGSFRNSLHSSFNSSRGGAGLAGHDFELLECIGCGAFGKVFRARERTSKETVAIKLIDMETADDDIEDIQKEVEVMAHCNSKHLVQYLHSYVYDTKLCVVMEYLAGSVRAFLSCGGLPEECTQAILHEVLQGLAYLHDEGKMHRDIKARGPTLRVFLTVPSAVSSWLRLLLAPPRFRCASTCFLLVCSPLSPLQFD
eukprot:6197217-Pleurochrysis_carterae.AAC.1